MLQKIMNGQMKRKNSKAKSFYETRKLIRNMKHIEEQDQTAKVDKLNPSAEPQTEFFSRFISAANRTLLLGTSVPPRLLFR